MSVTVSEHSGFCFGVSGATRAIEGEIASKSAGTVIYSLGQLIHNDVYLKRLSDAGVVTIGDGDIARVCREATRERPARVFVRAHGMTKEIEAELARCAAENPYFSFADCTCPYVKKIHAIVEKYSGSGRLLLLLGAADHPEVVGIVSRYAGERLVFSTADELISAVNAGKVAFDSSNAPIIVAQTTQKLDEWTKTKEFVQKVCTNSIIFDTICSVTDSRQREAGLLSRECDFMIVIGGKNSSNSGKLYSVCKRNCENTVWIESADELDGAEPGKYRKIGITAGASTPSDIIQEVYKKMSEKSFEELLNEQSDKTLNTGDTVTGYVTAISAGEIQLDLGAKVTGRIEFDQITDDPSVKLADMFKIGDAVDAFVIRVSDIDGMATLSKKRVDSDRNWFNVVAAKESGAVLDGKVVKAVKSGIIVSVGGVEVFVHESQTGTPKDTDLTTMIGNDVQLKIVEIKDQGKKAKGSIRQVLSEQRKAAEADFWANIEEGKYYTGKVKSMTAYGAFVDLGGVDGMVHCSELSWKRIKSPADVLSIGEEITVFVKSFDKEKGRISLGYKTEDTNPWYVFTHTYAVGDVVPVKIVSMMPFGAFAEIVDGVDGLIHISQIADRKIGKPADVLELGQVVDVKIMDVDMDKQKVTLSIRALIEEAKAAEEAMPEDVPAEDAAPIEL